MATTSKPRLVKPVKTSVEVEVSPRSIDFEGEDGTIVLGTSGIVVRGKPEFGVADRALDFARYMEERAPFWKADLLEYMHGRADWLPFLEAVIDSGSFTKATIDQYRYISRSVPKANRVEGLSLAFHGEVAALPADEQKPILEDAKSNHWSLSELRSKVRKRRKVKKLLRGQASDLAKAQDAVTEAAHEAAHLCREIPMHDCANSERLLAKARAQLEKVESAIEKYRRAQGKTK